MFDNKDKESVTSMATSPNVDNQKLAWQMMELGVVSYEELFSIMWMPIHTFGITWGVDNTEVFYCVFSGYDAKKGCHVFCPELTINNKDYEFEYYFPHLNPDVDVMWHKSKYVQYSYHYHHMMHFIAPFKEEIYGQLKYELG